MRRTAPNLLDSYHLLAFDSLDSTNEEARRLAKTGGAHGAVIWAKEQTAGRGRGSREWVSEPGNLYASFLLAPECPPEQAPQLSFVAAVAAYDALQPIIPQEHTLALKWPNDILVDGRKLGGILLESCRENGNFWVIVGAGINIDSFPQDTSYPATSLKSKGVEIVSAKIVLSRFIHHFALRYSEWKKRGFAPIRRAWLESAWGIDTPVRVSLPNEEVIGQFKGINTDGAIIVQQERSKRTIVAGDVFYEALAGTGVV